MTFQDSIRVCFTKYADFEGHASRPEFWWFTLFVLLVNAALSVIAPTLAALFGVAVLLPHLAAGARRLHDIGRSGWWQLLWLVPIGGVIALAIMWALPRR